MLYLVKLVIINLTFLNKLRSSVTFLVKESNSHFGSDVSDFWRIETNVIFILCHAILICFPWHTPKKRQ